MNKGLVAIGTVILALSSSVASAAPPALESRRVKMSAQLNAAQKEKVQASAKEVLGAPPSSDFMAVAKRANASKGFPPGMDIEALAFLVLMEATKDQEDDLRRIMAETQAENRKKAAIRAAIAARKAAGRSCADLGCVSSIAPTSEFGKPDIDALVSQLKAKADGQRDDALSDMSQEDQLKLQMLMNQKSKLEEMISNMVKKLNDVQSKISDNLKAS